MNTKAQRLDSKTSKRSESSDRGKKSKDDSLPSKRSQPNISKFPLNRASNVSPIRLQDVIQLSKNNMLQLSKASTKESAAPDNIRDQYQQLLLEQYGFDPLLPDTVNQLKELQRVLCGSPPKVENSSQYAHQNPLVHPSYAELSEDSTWQHIDTVDDIEHFVRTKVQECKYRESEGVARHRPWPNTDIIQFLEQTKEASVQPEPVMDCNPKNIHISEVPTIKFIAEKFSRFKKNDIELRKLNEKIVCVEYDIFDQDDLRDTRSPVQKMRAFFSIKPPSYPSGHGGKDVGKDAPLTEIPSFIKYKYHIANEDLKMLNEKEIEIIDEKIAENKPYLEDLKRILKRKLGSSNVKRKTNLDLQYLYEMAKRESPPSDYDFSKLLSRSELDEVKDLILKRCVSSVHGISRRIVRKRTEKLDRSDSIDGSNVSIDGDTTIISKSTIIELMRDFGKE